MKTASLHLVLLLLASLILSCASTPDEIRKREAWKTQRYADRQEKIRIRTEARAKRDQIWWDRVIGPEEIQ